jgi:DNA topoisomerase I
VDERRGRERLGFDPTGRVVKARPKGRIVRIRAGRGFSYRTANGERLSDPAEIGRIRALAVPPAWSDVEISSSPTARIQATGRDARGRQQYVYRTAFRRSREAAKFDSLRELGRVLPRIRRRVDRDLRRRGLPREKVLATVVALLEATRIRIGNREYAEANHSYGLTTFLPQQVIVEQGIVRFVFGSPNSVGASQSYRIRARPSRRARSMACRRVIAGRLPKIC